MVVSGRRRRDRDVDPGPRSWRWTLRRSALAQQRALVALQTVSVACLIAFAVLRPLLPGAFTVFLIGKRGAGMVLMPTDTALSVSVIACVIAVAVIATMLTWLGRSRQKVVPREAVNSAAVLGILGACVAIGLAASAFSRWSFALATAIVAGAVIFVLLDGARKRADDRWLLGAALDEIAAARRRAGLPPYEAETTRPPTPAPPAR
ncbi:hypothetical protein GCM10009748_34660 [Agromyces lapidis]